jgi:hypothetical protein
VDLQHEFPRGSGPSWRNHFNMSDFLLAYPDHPKVQPLVAQIGWTHNLIVIQGQLPSREQIGQLLEDLG